LRIPKDAGSCPSAHIALTSLGARGLKVSRSTRSAGLCRLLRHHLVYGAGREVETHAGNAIEVGSSHAEHFAHRAGGDLL